MLLLVVQSFFFFLSFYAQPWERCVVSEHTCYLYSNISNTVKIYYICCECIFRVYAHNFAIAFSPFYLLFGYPPCNGYFKFTFFLALPLAFHTCMLPDITYKCFQSSCHFIVTAVRCTVYFDLHSHPSTCNHPLICHLTHSASVAVSYVQHIKLPFTLAMP